MVRNFLCCYDPSYTGVVVLILWLASLEYTHHISSFYRHHLVQGHEYSCIVFAGISPALSAGEFDLTVLYSASLLVLYISDCTLHLRSYFTSLLVLCISVASSLIIMHFAVSSYMSLLLLYILYSAFLCDLVARMVSS